MGHKSGTHTAAEFAEVDASGGTAYFQQYLDLANSTGFMRTVDATMRARLALHVGGRYLDVGCGSGEDTRDLAGYVGPAGRVVGIDRSAAMVAEARARTAETGLPAEFRVGDAHRLDFPDGAFDGCRAERVLQHLDEPGRAVDEMVRVTRGGGRLVAADPDWETLVIDPGDPGVTRAILTFRTDRVRSGWVGRRLFGLFGRAGLQEVVAEPLTMVVTDLAQAHVLWDLPAICGLAAETGVVPAAAAQQWLRDLEAGAAAGTLFTAVTAFVVSGTRP